MSFRSYLKELEVDSTLTVKFRGQLLQLNPPALPGRAWAVIIDKELEKIVDDDGNVLPHTVLKPVVPVYPATLRATDYVAGGVL